MSGFALSCKSTHIINYGDKLNQKTAYFTTTRCAHGLAIAGSKPTYHAGSHILARHLHIYSKFFSCAHWYQPGADLRWLRQLSGDAKRSTLLGDHWSNSLLYNCLCGTGINFRISDCSINSFPSMGLAVLRSEEHTS